MNKTMFDIFLNYFKLQLMFMRNILFYLQASKNNNKQYQQLSKKKMENIIIYGHLSIMGLEFVE